MKTFYTAAVDVEGGRGGQATGIGGVSCLTLADPRELGGSGTGTNPEQLLAVALGASFGSALDLEARQIGCVIEPLRVTASVSLGHGDSDYHAISVELRCHLPSLPRGIAERLLRAARDACPYCRMIRGDVEITVLLASVDEV
ncbi:Ohr family peroxiredoxin [Roseomonas marmotae]|uniref:Ohr family peroxiredoxin n=1 Tax=Roseomonas marmotae TaxID=2768161 RepID=A0ABS3K8C2_9PROT|nr:Ohr family peroxiredoxin [Roseomonas marmotae]MBO1073717.1 Ohr family peroxiredoxin [Roseomonas marmotae]QTI78648.1 Ohr family peroxiredoxin [Roseomonas marmotae]